MLVAVKGTMRVAQSIREHMLLLLAQKRAAMPTTQRHVHVIHDYV
jgi:hypothetical protein